MITPDDAPSAAGHWADPGAHAVAPGVFRIPLPLPNDGLRAVNVYAILGDRGVDLVDSGWHRGDAWEQLGSGLAAAGAELGDVRRVLVTHIHHDHYGQAARLRDVAGAAVFLGAGERRSLETIIEVPGGPRDAGLRMLHASGAEELAVELGSSWARGGGDESRWEYPDTWADDGSRVELSDRTLEVVATPGHTTGHVAFVDRAAGLLFAGDHVLPRITPSIGLEVADPPLPLRDFLDSLAKVRDLPVTRVLPAHGAPFADLAGRVDELVEHHRARLDAVAGAVAGGASTAFAVARALRWTRHQRDYSELDLFNRGLAVRESLAHLELLVAQDRLTRTLEGETRVYAPRDRRSAPTGPRAYYPLPT